MNLIHNYRFAVDKFLLRIRNQFQAHGTDLRDALIECYPGNGTAADSTGDLLRAMMAEGLIVQHHTPAPNFSQRAFNGFLPGNGAKQYFYFKGPNNVLHV